MKTAFFAIITILVLVISITSNVYAQSSSTGSTSLAKVNVGLFNMTENSPTLVISGIIYKAFSQNIALTIFNPQNQLISVSQLQPRLDGTFSQSIILSDPLWPKGNYTVRMASGSQNLTESVFYFPGIGCCKRIITQGVQDQLSNSTILSPLKQIDNGIPTENITCSNDLELVYKTSNKYPACVKHTTAEKLMQRGWAIRGQPISYFVKTDGFLIPYDFIGGNMLGVKSDVQNKSVIFSVHTTSSGVLYVVMPRALLDSKSAYGNQDAKFIILVDKHEVKYTETTSITNRILSIPFDLGAKEIEITATVGI